MTAIALVSVINRYHINGCIYFETPCISIEYWLFPNKSIWATDKTGTLTSSQGRPGSNGNEGVLHTPQNSRNEASPPEAV